jgi:hypothetical protein
MLFYDKNGELRNINKLDFINDKLYYQFITKCKVSRLEELKVYNNYPVENQLLKLI